MALLGFETNFQMKSKTDAMPRAAIMLDEKSEMISTTDLCKSSTP